MAACALRAVGLAVLSAAIAAVRRKTARIEPGTVASAGLDWKPSYSSLDHARRKALQHEKRGDRFRFWTSGASQYEPFRRLAFTPVLSCEPGVSVLMERFDWRLVPDSAWESIEVKEGREKVGTMTCAPVDGKPWRNNSHIRDPSTVWAAPHSLPLLLELAERDFDKSHARRVVMFSGTEMPLSRAFGDTHAQRMETVRRLRKYFSVIRYMTKDIRLEHVSVAPMGLGWGYTITFMDAWLRYAKGKKRYTADKFMDFEAMISNRVESKTKNMLAVRSVWAGWLDLLATVKKAKKLNSQGLLYPPSNTSCKAVIFAYYSRLAMRTWAATPEAEAVGVEMKKFSQAEWFTELGRYRFLLNPLGSAIQTAKSLEALLVLTVPVIQRTVFPAHDELVALGFPFVMVEKWSEITKAMTDRWWRKLAPRLESFRKNCLTVDGYWGMITGRIEYCA